MKNTIARFFSNAANPKIAQVGGEPKQKNNIFKFEDGGIQFSIAYFR